MDRFSKRVGGLWTMPLRLVVALVLWAPLAGAFGGSFALARWSDAIPKAPDITALHPTRPSLVETRTGWRLAGQQSGAPVTLDELPPRVTAAFLAAEDADFFEHDAFNLKAILRAALTDLSSGEKAEGASTITQQLAKRFLSSKKTLRRKYIELLMARRIEATYSKPQILEAYLNNVYFGEGAHGIAQASWTYFGRPAAKLDVGQAALLAGILPAPSAYNPVVAPQRAKRERDQVLRRMGTLNLLDADAVRQAVAEPVRVVDQRDVQPERMPYAVTSALRSLEDNFDDKAWAEGGYTVVVPHSPVRQARARAALRASVAALDRRQGFHGPLGHVVEAAEVDRRLAAQSPDWDFVLARVASVSADAATIVTAGGQRTLGLAQASWAAPMDRPRHYKHPAVLDDLSDILKPDDLVVVRREQGLWHLVQFPAYEGAFIAVDSKTGGVYASVGGFDADRSIFHRAEQGCRQPGSVFKPVVYSEALAQGLTAATMLADLPGSVATGRGKVWQPTNADRDFKGYIMLANALAWSRNIPTVHLMNYLGIANVVKRGHKLGITSHIATTSSSALGASCVRPIEMARVYAAFQRRGRTVDVSPVAYIVDARGDVIVDHEHFSVADWSTAARLDRIATEAPPAKVGVSEQVAYIITRILRRVVTSGTAHDLPDDWKVAGKTGTTNKYDGWFVGFDGNLTGVAWVGSDKNKRPLGRGEHGATVAMPIFEQFYSHYVDPDPALFDAPPPKRVVFQTIDSRTGLRSAPGEPGVKLPFIAGSAPTEYAPTRGTRQAEHIDTLSQDF